jgi:hypothetical protein
VGRHEERPYFLDQYQPFVDELEEKGFQYVGAGGSRRTYLSNTGRVVVKVPRCSSGLLDNYAEAKTWKLYHSRNTRLGFPVAPCRMIRNGCLMMVAVAVGQGTRTWEYINEFNSYILDGDQSGLYKGRTVVYDYAYDVPERLLWERELGIASDWQFSWLRCNKHLQVDFEKEKADAQNSRP